MAQSFYLSEFNIDASSTLATVSGADTNAFTGDATAEFTVAASVIQDLLNFQSDSTDINNVVADDLLYKVVYTTGTHPLSNKFIASANVTSGSIHSAASNNTLPYDYVRYLADEMFGTHLGVDLFNNEEELRTGLDSAARISLDNRLVSLAALGNLDANAIDNPAHSVFNQIIKNSSTRLNTLTVASTGEDGSTWYKVPVLAGDMLFFVMTVKADPTQMAVVDAANPAIANRTYLIKMTLE